MASGALTLLGSLFGAVAGASATQATSGGASGNSVRACALPTLVNEMACMVLVRTDVPQRSAAAVGNGAPVGSGYGPSQLQSAYKLPSSTAGKKQIVAVVDAYNDPKAVSDFNIYRSSWGLPACNTTTKAGCLTVVNENGATSPLPMNGGSTGWATEESLDVDMVAAICPNCHVYLVEANSQFNLGPRKGRRLSRLGGAREVRLQLLRGRRGLQRPQPRLGVLQAQGCRRDRVQRVTTATGSAIPRPLVT